VNRWRRQLINFKIIIFIFVAVFLCGPAFAGWSEGVRLTYRGYEMAPQVIARNDTVHVAWEQSAGNSNISYLRSVNGGQDWADIVDLNETGHLGYMPDLSLSGNGVFIGWGDTDTMPVNFVSNVGYAFSSGGDVWSVPSYVFRRWISGGYGESSMILVDHTIYLAYMPPDDFDSLGNHLILFRRSTDLGASWCDSQVIGRTPMYLNGFQMAVCDGSIYVIWSGRGWPITYSYEVIAAVSRDGGRNWDTMYQISPDSSASQDPCIACDPISGTAVVAWMDYRESHGFPGDLFVRVTSDGGLSWGDGLVATHHHRVSGPALAVAGDTIWAAWQDWGGGTGFSKSTDDGQTWSPYEILAPMGGVPWLSYDRGRLHLVWDRSNPAPEYGQDIYYMRFDPDPIGIQEGNSIPRAITISAYPNPFNSSVTINCSFQEERGGELEIYNIQGQKIRTFHLEGKEGKINWDATDASGEEVSSGIYFARARTDREEGTIRLLLLR